ncbi:phosphoribosyltransferase-like protein, partial [Fimicolochytrium jonesii]|uniref:phosphoribosyltransferase-like protein n=1 Tax=Fimicolochytrium jonesii TaxID=1396493 RepID=UPI0022FE9558
VKIFTGSSHPDLAALILDRLGCPAAPAVTKRFSNAETAVEIGVSVRDEDVYLIQSGSMHINDHLMELLIMINACKIASAKRITAVVPYFPYNKQSKKKKARGAITAKLVANMLATAGVDHVITMDLHSTQVQGFFKTTIDNLVAEPCIAQYIKANYPNYQDSVVISKNAGGVKRVTALADKLQTDFALIHRERYHIHQSSKGTAVLDDEGRENRLTLVGDVNGRDCFVLDDIIDGTHSFLDAAEHLKRCKASTVRIIATHGILSGNAMQEIDDCEAVDEVIVTNTYPLASKQKASKKLRVIDISGVLAEAIRRNHNGESISYLFHTAI